MDYILTFISNAFFSDNTPKYADVNTIINYYKSNILITSNIKCSPEQIKILTRMLLKIPFFCNEVISLFDSALSSYIVHFACIDNNDEFIEYYVRWIYIRVLLFKIRTLDTYTLTKNDNEIFNNIEYLLPGIINSTDENIQFLMELKNIYIPLWNNDTASIISQRSNFEKTIMKNVATFNLWKNNVLLEPYDTLPIWYFQPAFGLTYHTSNNSTLFGLLGQFYKQLLSLRYPDIQCDIQIPKPKNTPLKIGFLSNTFYNHAIGRISVGLIEKLHEYSDIDTYIYSNIDNPKIVKDTFANRIYNASTKYRIISTIDITNTVQQIRDDNLDALIIVDPCSDIYTYCVGIYRCAPLQITTWGHPDTSGSPNIDYYLTSKIFEKQIDNLYFEKPYYMKSLGFYYYNLQNTHGFDPIEMFKNTSQIDLRKSLNLHLPSNAHIYGILSSMYKFHPSFDIIINGILYNDKNAYIILIQGVNNELCKKIIERLNKTISNENINRIIMLPYQIEPYSYERLLLSCDVILDTFPFGGCISTYDAFSCNKCIVTFPGNKLSGRFTQGLYNKMERCMLFDEIIAKDEITYIEAALKVATYPAYRRSLEKKIADNKYKLYEDSESIEEWYQFLKTHC